MMPDRQQNFNIDFIDSRENIDTLVLMITYNCQMNCRYCEVEQKRGGIISRQVYEKAVRLLLDSRSREVALKFFGGEPLLYPDLLWEIMAYAENEAKKVEGKKIKFFLTTNGVLLDNGILEKLEKYKVEILFSFDGNGAHGSGYRQPRVGNNMDKIIENLKNFAKKNKDSYFVNMVVAPDTVDKLADNFEFIADLGVKRIQVGYRSGILWENERIISLISGFSKIKDVAAKRGVSLLNLKNNCEPVMLSDDVLVDVDGAIYHDIVIFHEKGFPRFRQQLKISDVFSAASLDKLQATKRQIFEKLAACYQPGQEKNKIIMNNIQVGLVVKEFWDDQASALSSKTESRFIPRLLSCAASEQKELMESAGLGIDHYILRISNNCLNDCLFCKNKKVPVTSLEYVEYKIKDNKRAKQRKICLVGNEPLNHPKIIDILSLCNRYGFKEIQVMTSGMFLKDKKFLQILNKHGVRSVSLPIYSPRPEVHDKIVQRRGDYSDLMRGIENMKKYPDIKIFLHSNIIKQNIDDIKQLEKFVVGGITPNFCILPTRCKLANLNYREITPSYTDMVNKIRSESIIGYPLCVLNKIQKKVSLSGDKISAAIKVYLLDQNFIKLDKCGACRLKSKCLGTFKDYIAIYGTKEICPIKKK